MSEAFAAAAVAPPPRLPNDERIRLAYQRRNETDYLFSFWSALGWMLLTVGIYRFYVVYQLVRRMRDHNQRRGELLDAATAFAWEKTQEQGLEDELRPHFERIGQHMAPLGMMNRDFRDPAVWLALTVVGQFVVRLIAWAVLDGDLVKHDFEEGAVEAELSHIYTRLGTSIPPPDPRRLKARHKYVVRLVVYVLTLTIYGLWWYKDLFRDGNRHFQHNWVWEDNLAQAVQRLSA